MRRGGTQLSPLPITDLQHEPLLNARQGEGGTATAATPAAAAAAGSVLSWAHIKDVTQLPDAVWQRVAAPIRSAYITFAFSGGGGAGEGEGEGLWRGGRGMEGRGRR